MGRDLQIRNPSTSIEAYDEGLKTSPPGPGDAERTLSMRITLLIVAAMLAAFPVLARATLPHAQETIMRIPTRHWLDYDSVALTVLMIAISILELFVFCI